MKVVIMGCGRTGSLLASMLDADGHAVTAIDVDPVAFSRLPDTYRGETVLGDALEGDVLVRAGIADADVFVAATLGDNRNIMASQVARAEFGVPRVVTRIKDPARAEIYRGQGLLVDCRTTQGTTMIMDLVTTDAS